MSTSESSLLSAGQETTDTGAQGTTDAVAATGQQAEPTSTVEKTAEPTTAAAVESTETKAEEGKTAEAEAPKPKAPETYEFKLPEGIELDAVSTEKFSAIAKELDLSQEQAQQLVSLEAERIQSQAEAHARTVAEWRTAVETDKALGGDHLKESVAVTSAVMSKFGSPEVKALLEQTGLGNHPALFRMFHQIGKAIAQDRFVVGGETGSVNTDLASRLYPNQA